MIQQALVSDLSIAMCSKIAYKAAQLWSSVYSIVVLIVKDKMT